MHCQWRILYSAISPPSSKAVTGSHIDWKNSHGLDLFSRFLIGLLELSKKKSTRRERSSRQKHEETWCRCTVQYKIEHDLPHCHDYWAVCNLYSTVCIRVYVYVCCNENVYGTVLIFWTKGEAAQCRGVIFNGMNGGRLCGSKARAGWRGHDSGNRPESW
jgi:hypothetical protein